ncbi:MAG TPA: pseudouridine synthase [Candidatus Kapabacteria bacterium]|nr:pseudouridine synthase [Candidatus Kapabacteria bacterium]
MRLNRFIASSGVTSRRKADELITQGKVKVNGKLVTELGVQIKPYEDQVVVDGKTISLRERRLYILLNKPKDYITTVKDEKDRRTVMDLVKSHERLYPVGRLDRNTTGVLLLTNDGELTARLTHPRYEIRRTYHAILDKPLKREDAQKIAKGSVHIGRGNVTSAVELDLSARDAKDVIITLREGKYHEVRRLFETAGYEVEKLDRIAFAGLTHQGMKRGESRVLTPKEIRALKRTAGLKEDDFEY